MYQVSTSSPSEMNEPETAGAEMYRLSPYEYPVTADATSQVFVCGVSTVLLTVAQPEVAQEHREPLETHSRLPDLVSE